MTSFATVAAMGLLLVRPGVLVMMTPLLGAVQTPPQLRIGITLLIAIILVPFVTLPTGLSLGSLTMVIAREVAIGLALALSIQVLIAGAEFAGHFAGLQIGLSLGSLIDPQSGVSNNVLAILYANVVTMICFASNAHHVLLHALADSYAVLPIGAGGVDATLATSVSHLLGLVFTLGVRISAPVIVVLLLVEVALGLLARVAPALNVMVAGTPIRVIVGLLVIAASVTALPALIGHYVPTLMQAAARTADAFK